MNSEIICACCGHDISAESRPECDYCGYINIAAIGRVGVDQAGIISHRKQILQRLKDISIVSYKYGWNETQKEYMLLAQEKLKLADGEQCDGRIFWTPHEFGQVFEEGKTIDLELQYIYAGNIWSAKYPIKPRQCESFWHIGVEINERLKLVFYLGNKNQNVKGSELSFIRK